jgi:hypothetical protein
VKREAGPVERELTITLDCRPTEREVAAVREVAAEVHGKVEQDGDVWSLVVRRAADAEFAGMRLATEVNGILVDDGAGGRRVELGHDREVLARDRTAARSWLDELRDGQRTVEPTSDPFER